MPKLNNQNGFTLIELMIIIVILGILAAVAIPKYQSISDEACVAKCRSGLGALRSRIIIYCANQAVTTGRAEWPIYDSLTANGVVMSDVIPDNPYADYPDSVHNVDSDYEKGWIPTGKSPGWIYKESTGEIWPGTYAQRYW